jgi:hypothetical protein
MGRTRWWRPTGLLPCGTVQSPNVSQPALYAQRHAERKNREHGFSSGRIFHVNAQRARLSNSAVPSTSHSGLRVFFSLFPIRNRPKLLLNQDSLSDRV